MDRSGALIYRVDLPPDALPCVRASDLGEGWDAARQAATAAQWGEPRIFRFLPGLEDSVDLALTDEDAACWAEAIDCVWSLQTPYGLSICLRLLGLVALLASSRSLRSLCAMPRGGAELDPALLRAAASVSLSRRGHLDEALIRGHLAQASPHLLPTTITHSGAES